MSFSSPRRRFRPAHRRSAASRRSPVRPFRSGETLDGGRETDHPSRVRHGREHPRPRKKAERVEITKGPELELAADHLTIIRWTTNNPGGSDVHYGIVHYGTDPKDLSQTAKN